MFNLVSGHLMRCYVTLLVFSLSMTLLSNSAHGEDVPEAVVCPDSYPADFPCIAGIVQVIAVHEPKRGAGPLHTFAYFMAAEDLRLILVARAEEAGWTLASESHKSDQVRRRLRSWFTKGDRGVSTFILSEDGPGSALSVVEVYQRELFQRDDP